MIEALNLDKAFGGRPAIKGVSFKVAKGEILGFLGPNGSGKTTTMRILTGYMPADAGTARVDGFDVFEQPLEVKRRIGYLPENPPLYPEMTVRPYLDFAARIRQVPSKQIRARVDAALDRCGLATVAGRLIGNLSKGFKQRVGLAQAILHDPPVLILDEPTVGLDPEQIIEIRNLIKGLGGEHTVILSTHILPEVTITCSRVAIISYGEIVQEGSLEGLTAASGMAEKLRLRVARDGREVADALSRLPGVLGAIGSAGEGAYTLEIEKTPQAREAIASAVVRGGWGLLELTPITRTLEEIYIEARRRMPGEEPAGSPPRSAGEAREIKAPAAAVAAGGGGA